ncbi:hypothetical protein [Caulobacter soli]|uniref:hypothetical protein n=1 Tax=Caulobacter soli TaxID=2708539 RepID=UPI0013EA4C38|nr:hypothetical protein [Caulobacter soli]
MFDLINTVMGWLRKTTRSAQTRLGEAPDDHVHAFWDHLDELEWAEGRAEHLAEEAARAAREQAWAKLADEERDAIIVWCDDLNAQGRLVDHPFYDQWLALRMTGYVGD